MSLSTKKINVGIIGSSFSTGRREYHYRLEDLFRSANPDFEYHNLSCGGKGSEKYLQSLIKLKQKFDIDVLLMELVYNRSAMNVPLSNSFKNPTQLDLSSLMHRYYKSQGYQEWEVHLQHDDGVFPLWKERPFIRDMTWGQQSKLLNIVSGIKEVQAWQKVQLEIASNYIMRETLAVIDYESVVSACKMLGIKLVSWSHNQYTRFSVKCFDDLLTDLNRVCFGNSYNNARQFFEKKHRKKQILCDGVHFSKEIDSELVNDWLLPAIQSAIEHNK